MALAIKILLFLLAFLLQTHLIDCVYCYACTSANLACLDPIDQNKLQYFVEPCNGDCIIYENPNSGFKTRGCSWSVGILESQNGQKTVNGVTYQFCSSDLCNGGNSVVVTTNKAITTTQVCNKKCENGGNLKSATCTCECLNPYNGPQCENVNCAIEYQICTSGSVSECNSNIVYKLFCPKLCNPKC